MKVNQEEKKAARQAIKEEKQALKAAKTAEKKAKKQAKQQAKQNSKKNAASAAQQAPEKGRKKFLIPVILIAILAIGAGAFFFLRKGGDSTKKEDTPPEPIDAPVTYQVGDASLPALPVWGRNTLVYLEDKPEDAPKTEATYRYEGFQNPQEIMSAYINLLTLDDVGFDSVDDSLVRQEEALDLESQTGNVHLAHTLPEDMVLDLHLSWTEKNCLVKIDAIEGKITNPPEEINSAYGNAPMSLTEALDRVKSLDPAKLGLPGQSMDEYEIYSEMGSVLIGGTPCIRLNVYHNSQENGTNENVGNLFISSDGQHLYRLNIESNTVQELLGVLDDTG